MVNILFACWSLPSTRPPSLQVALGAKLNPTVIRFNIFDSILARKVKRLYPLVIAIPCWSTYPNEMRYLVLFLPLEMDN